MQQHEGSPGPRSVFDFEACFYFSGQRPSRIVAENKYSQGVVPARSDVSDAFAALWSRSAGAKAGIGHIAPVLSGAHSIKSIFTSDLNLNNPTNCMSDQRIRAHCALI